MGCLKRAAMSSIHHKKRFFLVLLILLIASVFLQVSYQIRTAAAESVAQIRRNIGASVIVYAGGLDPQLSVLSGIRAEEYFPYDIAQEIAGLPEVNNSRYLSTVNVFSDDIDGIKLGLMDEDEYKQYFPGGPFKLIGVSDMQSFWNFAKGKDHLVEGRFLSPGETGNAAVVSKRVFDFNVLKLEDKFSVSSYFNNDISEELETVGIHSGEDLDMQPEYICNINFIYAPLEAALSLSGVNGITEAEFALNDPIELDAFLDKAKVIAEENDLNLVFENDNLDFLLASTALNSLIKTCDAIFITVIAMSAIILSLLVIYLMSDRFFEIGVLLSLGESRYKISLQMILEILMPGLIAINIGALVSSLIIPAVGKAIAVNMQIDQQLTSMNVGSIFVLANVCGILLVIIASIVPTAAIRNYTPKKIMQTFK